MCPCQLTWHSGYLSEKQANLEILSLMTDSSCSEDKTVTLELTKFHHLKACSPRTSVRISCNTDISIGHPPISQSDFVPLLSQLDILQYLKQTLCLCCLNWTFFSIPSRFCVSAVLTGHSPVSRADSVSLAHICWRLDIALLITTSTA
jgi:hypothetical protein